MRKPHRCVLCGSPRWNRRGVCLGCYKQQRAEAAARGNPPRRCAHCGREFVPTFRDVRATRGVLCSTKCMGLARAHRARGDLGIRLRLARTTRRQSLAEVARVVGCTRQCLSLVELGRTHPREDLYSRLTQWLEPP